MMSAAEVDHSGAVWEWERLARDAYHGIEFLVTMYCLRKHLPATGTILDAGGGPGRYCIELCRAGYNVVLLDIAPAMTARACEMIASEPAEVRGRLRECMVGDVRDLSRFESGIFDAVLCIGGPLTYIANEPERRQAMAELVRVAKPGAVVAVSVAGFLAALRTILMGCADQLDNAENQEMLRKGNDLVHGNVWHFFRADELWTLGESCGLTTLEIAGCEGLSTGLAEATNRCAEDPERWRWWMDWILATATEPAVADMAEHILYVGRAPV